MKVGSKNWTDPIGLAAVLAAGATLRFWNLSAGFPYRIGVDEPVIAERAIHILRTGNFHPHFFDYPGLYIYVQVVVGWLRFVSGANHAPWRTVDEFWPEHLFLWTRALNATLGTVTLFIVYRAGLRWGRGVALLAAGLLAVWPNHVRESHFALTDVPLTLWTTLTLLLSLRAHETGRLVWLIAAGASVGLAAATKYNGAIAFVMPLIAAVAVATPPSVRAWRGAAVAGAAGVTFLIGAPYTLLDLPAFLNASAYMASRFRARAFREGAMVYLGHLRVALGWPGLVAVNAGIVWGMLRAIRDGEPAKWLLLLAFPLLYFYTFATRNLIYGRYLLPILPFLSILMAIVIVDVVVRIVALRQPMWVRSIAATAFVAVVTVQLVGEGIAWPRRYGKRTTQDVAYGMIRRFIPERSGVAIERSVLRLPDSAYRAVNVRNLTERSAEEYVSSGITYLIASSDEFGPVFARPDAHPDMHRAYRRLFETGLCLPTVEPTPAVPGPQIRICRLWTP